MIFPAAQRDTRAASAGDVWVFYSLDPIPDRWWYTVIWVALSVLGAAVQITTAGKGFGKKRKAKAQAA